MAVHDPWQDAKTLGCAKNRAHPLCNKSEYASKSPECSGQQSINQGMKNANIVPGKIHKPTFKMQGEGR